MANPFYIPAGPSVGERVAQPLTELMRIRQAGRLGEEHNRLAGEDIALRSRGQDLQAQSLAETQRANKAKEPISRQNFGKNEAAMFCQMLERLKIAKPLKFLTDDFTSMAENPGIDKGSFYGFFKQAWPEYQGRIVESLKEAAMDETQTPWMKQHYTKLADAIEKDKDGKLLDTLMSNVAMEWQAAQQGKQTENTPDKIQLVNDFIQRFGRNPTEQEVAQLYGMAKPVQAQQEFAPDMQPFINSKNGQSMLVNARDPQSLAAAQSMGFSPITPEARGYGTEIGKKSADMEMQINKDSKAARNQIMTLQGIDELLDRFESGKLANVGMSLQQYANALGIPIDTQNLASKEAFTAFVEQLALQSRNQGEGMVLAGAMSDRDVQFLRNMNAQMITSKGGNKQIIRMRIAIAKRQAEAADLMRQYKEENGGRFDASGFEGYMQEKFGKQSIFGIPEGSQMVGTDSKTGLPVYKTPNGKHIIPSF